MLLVVLGLPATANATLRVVTPDSSSSATFVGHGGYSADGLGQSGPGGSVQAEVPAGSNVVQAYLYGSYYYNSHPSIDERTIDFDGTTVVLDTLPNSDQSDSIFATARTEVTAQVAAKVGAGGGITDFVVNSDPGSLDGVALVVIYSNPLLPTVTIAVLDGASKQAGDQVTLNFSSAVDPSAPGFAAQLSLGSGFSYQGAEGHNCGAIRQDSTVSVNSTPLTSCAGNYDDGVGANGALITVGGVGDSLDNPTDPTSASGTDDELYNLTPFIHSGDTSLTLQTANPSGDDNLFLAVVEVTAATTSVTVTPPTDPTPDPQQPQSITFTSTQPSPARVGDTYAVTASASSGLPVAFSIDASSTAGACSVVSNGDSTATVRFMGAGTCVIDADQAGDATYAPAPQVHQDVTVSPALSPYVDTSVSYFQATPAASVTSPTLATSGGKELLVAYVETDGKAKAKQRVKTVTGGGLTWKNASYANTTYGTAEVWTAYATTQFSGTVTATYAGNYDAAITVTAYKNASSKIGAVKGASGTGGTAAVSITTKKANSLVWASGHNWSSPATPVPATGQTLVYTQADPSNNNQYWVQSAGTTGAAKTVVTVSAALPANSRWGLAAIEIQSAS